MIGAGVQRRALWVSAVSVTVFALQGSAAGATEIVPVAQIGRSATIGGGAAFKMPFKLPAGAREGHGTWYLVRLDVSLQASRSRSRGVATLIADINGLATNLVEVRVRPKGENCWQVLTWATVDLLKGDRHHSRCGYRASFISSNFPQIRAIRPGPRWLRVSVDDPQDVIEKVKLNPGSGVYRTDAGPAKLRIELRDQGGDFPPGEWSRIGFSVVNVGHRPARDTRVRVEADSALDVKRRSITVRPLIRPGGSTEASVWVRPRGAEPVRLGIVAEGQTARAATEVVVEPSPPEESASLVGRISLLVALVGVALLFFGAFTKNRHPAQA